MYWLDNNTGISTAPTPPAVISLTKKFFTNGGIGEQPSIPEDFWFNMVQEELLGVLTMAGIAPAKGDLGQLAKAIQSIAFSAYPVGAPIPWPTAVPPSGFLAMTGQSFSASTYPKLAIAYPNGVIPDLRACFIRGYDDGLGVDPGRQLLSLQLDEVKEHIHFAPAKFNASSGTSSPNRLSAGVNTATDAPDSSYRTTGVENVDGSPAGGAENRVRNRNFYYIVRAL